MPIDNLKQDFEDLKNYISERNLVPATTMKTIEAKLRRVHRICFSIAVWESQFSRRKEHKKIFLREMRSDAIQSVSLILFGHRKSACLMVRGLVENALKHVFFFTHPVEYEWLKSASGYHISMSELYGYVKKLPVFAPYYSKRYSNCKAYYVRYESNITLNFKVHSSYIIDEV